MKVKAHKILTANPADVSGLENLIQTGEIHPFNVVCIIGKTEGNGGTNDFSRNLAMISLESLFAPYLGLKPCDVQEKIIFSFSGGTEGVVSPHMIVFTKEGEWSSEPRNIKRLVVGVAYTRVFEPAEIGRMAQIEETSRVIKELATDLRLESMTDIHLIQMKGAIPSYTYEQGVEAQRLGRPIRSNMVYSRGASALGAAVAVGEVNPTKLSDDDVCSNWDLYSGVASTSAKPGLTRTEIIMFANSPYATGDLEIGHVVIKDMIDTPSIKELLVRLGFDFDVQLSEVQKKKIVGVFAKAEADPRGNIRGHRHTMLTDDDISDTRYSRCVLSSVLSSVIGNTAIYVSTRAEHHGPLGGGTLAAIVNTNPCSEIKIFGVDTLAQNIKMNRIELKLVDATRENTKDYGILIDTTIPNGGLNIPFYKGSVVEGYNLPFEYEENVVIRTARISKRDPQLKWLERHLGLTQLFICLGDQPFAIILGKSTIHSSSPNLDDLVCFKIPAGHGIMIHKGTWHDFPLAIDLPVTCLTMNSEKIVKALASMKESAEMNHGDVEKIDIMKRLGVQVFSCF